MIVNENPRRSEHIISGSGPLAYNFGVLDPADLKVIQGGVVLDPSQYQVTGVGQDGGGTVILATAPDDGTQVVIIGDQPFKQTSVYTNEAFPPQRIQNDFNKVVIGLQQLAEIDNRSFHVSESSQLDVPDIPAPTTPDTFLRAASIDPLIVDWATLAVLEGAVGIPLSFIHGGTGGVYTSASTLMQGLGGARWAPIFVTPSSGIVTLGNPLIGNRVAVDTGAISSISTSGVAIGTLLIFDYVVGGNALTDSTLFQLQGRSNYTTAVNDRSIFYFNGTGWLELFRSPALVIGNAGKFMRGDGTWQSIAVLVPTGVSRGLTCSNNATDPSNDIEIAAGDAFSDEADPTLRVQMYSSGIFVKQLDNTWVAGTGNGGRINGQTLSDGTWHVFMFKRLGGEIDFCISNSLVFVTPDSGTNRVCIMSMKREFGVIVPFTQEGDYVAFKSPIIDVELSNPGILAQTILLRGPRDIKCMVRYILQLRIATSPGTACVAYTSDLAETDLAPSLDGAPLYNVGLVNLNHLTTVRELETMSNLGSQIRARINVSNVGTLVRFVTRGYYHPRGRR